VLRYHHIPYKKYIKNSQKKRNITSSSTTNSPSPFSIDMSLTPINSLMYADDVAIIGQPSDVQQLLLLAETHSMIFGYRWNPFKCEVLNCSPDTTFSLYNTAVSTLTLPSKDGE
jgi:hypothetical protein